MAVSRQDFLKLSGATTLILAGAAELFSTPGFLIGLLPTPLREGTVRWGDAGWRRRAIEVLWREWQSSGSTPVVDLAAPFNPAIRLIFKNEEKVLREA